MTWFAALATGVGLGLAYFGGLWLTVRHAAGRRGGALLLALSRFARLALAGLTFYALLREGTACALAGLLGLLLARWHLLSWLGGDERGA
ncbi:MAG TPA: ATP synthase subunit I [Gemmataceae bacterium]|nr:ATP synthase subunit I [Gemmataceae bacterium]